MTSYSLYEQETVITMNRGDDLVNIYTANPAHIRHLTKDDRLRAARGNRD